MLPWTNLGLYDWMHSNVAGINLKTAPGQLYCCDVINGKKYFSYSLQDATQREYKRTWPGISNSLNFYAHEIRHADPGAPGHTTGCAVFPNPTDPYGCDATYDLANLGSYGVQYWLESSWATGYLNIGIGCSAPPIPLDYATWDATSANLFRDRFVTNVPPLITATAPYGGPCGYATILTLASSVNPSVVGQTVSLTATVSSSGGTPTGSVSFKDEAASICLNVSLAAGQATCTVSSFAPGVHTISAEYTGDNTYGASTGALSGGQTVNKASTTTRITGHSPHPSRAGDAVTVNYSVMLNAPGSGIPTGTVTVSDGVDSCTGSVAAGNCVLQMGTTGTRTLIATYPGDTNLEASTSTGVSHIVNAPGFKLDLPLIVR